MRVTDGSIAFDDTAPTGAVDTAPASRHIARLCIAIGVAAVAAQSVMIAMPTVAAKLPESTSMLSAHLVLELFAIVIATLIVTVSWHNFSVQGRRPANLLIAGFIVVGVCDLVHALTYEGMPTFLGATSTERAIFFWLMGRSAEVATLGLIAIGWVPRLSRNASLALGMLVAAALVWFGSEALASFPATFVAGRGVTPFKAAYEVVLCALDALVAVALWRRARREGDSGLYLLATSAWVVGVGELSFTAYVAPSDFSNVFGHVYKLVAYALLYRGTFIASLRAPFDALRRSEARANESERRIRSIGDNLPNCVIYQVVREPDGRMRFLHVSESSARILGIAAADAMADPQRLYASLDAEDQAVVAAAEQRSAETMTVFSQVVPMRHRDGRPLWVRLASAPHRLADGRICWDGVAVDITEHRNAVLQREENAALLAAVIDSASDAVISTDAAGHVTLFNPAAERIFGRPAATQVGRSLDELLPAAERARHARRLADFAANGASPRSMSTGRVPGLRADGSALELEASISKVTVNARTVLTAILRDVTERVRTERALVNYQLELTELTHRLMAQEKQTTRRLAQALHDQLGQTLTAMRIDFVSEAKLADAAEAARHARVDWLIDQAIVDVRQALAELRPTLLDESGLVAALDNELRTRQRAAGGLTLVLDAGAELAALRWDPDVEYAAFMIAREAIANALQHAHCSRVRVTLSGGPGRMRLEVADDGRGLAADALTLRPGHLGLIGMRERAIAIGARLDLGAAPGGGASVCLSWEETGS